MGKFELLTLHTYIQLYLDAVQRSWNNGQDGQCRIPYSYKGFIVRQTI